MDNSSVYIKPRALFNFAAVKDSVGKLGTNLPISIMSMATSKKN